MSFLCSPLKGALSHCSFTATERDSFDGESDLSEDLPPDDTGIEHMIISVMQSRAWEARHRPKNSFLSDSLKWVFSPMTGEFTIAPKEGHEQGLPRLKEEDEPEAYLSVNSSFSPCSSTEDVELKDMGSCRILVYELRQCQGWPFGLMCQKPVVLPPLPSTPSESWVWRRVNSELAHKKY